jgi:D-alanyl-D-alanine carboxypeptidase
MSACIAIAGCTVTSTDPTPGAGVEGAGGPAAKDTVAAGSNVPSTSDVSRHDGASVTARATTTVGSTRSDAQDIATTTTEAPLTGWQATDAHLRRRLIGNGDTAASFALSIDGEIVHTAAFGIRSLVESDATEPTDRFRVASVSKTISAITMLQLVEEGLVGLDEAVGGRVAAALGVDAVLAGTADITVRQLLSHTSGFAQYENLFFGGQVSSCRDAAGIGLTRSLQGAPGGSFRYSNMNYCVVGLLIEVLTGTSYEQAVYERVLTPLGISGMRLAPTYDPGPDEVDHRTVFGRNYMEALGAAGAWVATPSDLVTILDSLDLTKPGWKPLDAATLAVMQTSANDPLVPDRGYGLGLILYGAGAHGHTGTIESTHAMMLDRHDGVTWALTVSGEYPNETGQLAGIVDDALVAGGFVTGAALVLD